MGSVLKPINKNSKIEVDSGVFALFIIAFTLLFIREAFRLQQLILLPDLLDKLFYSSGISLMLFVDLIQLRGSSLKVSLIKASILICGVLSYFLSGDTVGLSLMTVIVGVSSVGSIRTVMSYWSLLTLLTVASVFLFFLIQILSGNENVPLFFQRSNDASQNRLSMGFEHPNSFASLCLMFIIASWQNDEVKRDCKRAFLYCALSVVVFSLTRSRVALFLSLLYIAVRLSLQSYRMNKIIFKYRHALYIIPMFLFLLTYLLAGPLYNDKISGLFTNRVRLWHSFYLAHGLSPCGQPFSSSQYTTSSGIVLFSSTLDSAYAYCLFVGGCTIGIVIILLLYMYTRNINQEDVWQIVGIAVVLLLAFTETTAVWIMASGPLMYVAGGIAEPLHRKQVVENIQEVNSC